MIGFEELSAHHEFLTALAGRLVDDRHLADDLVQETWLTALRRPPRHGRNLRSWLAAVLRSRISNRYRTRGRRIDYELRAFRPPRFPSPDEVVMQRDLRERVVEAIEAQPARYREVLVPHLLEGRSTSQIASDLHLGVPSIRTRLGRGLAKLRASIARAYGDQSAVDPLGALPSATR